MAAILKTEKRRVKNEKHKIIMGSAVPQKKSRKKKKKAPCTSLWARFDE